MNMKVSYVRIWNFVELAILTWVAFYIYKNEIAPALALIASGVIGNWIIYPRWESYNRKVKYDPRHSKGKRRLHQAAGYAVAMLATLTIFCVAYGAVVLVLELYQFAAR